MYPAILILVVGQCPGGSCPSPSLFGGYPMPAPVMMQAPAPRVVYVQAPAAIPLARRRIDFQGMEITVEGTMKPDGDISWYQDSPFNAAAIAAGRAKVQSEAAREVAAARVMEAVMKPFVAAQVPAVPPALSGAASDDDDRPVTVPPPIGGDRPFPVDSKTTNYGLAPNRMGRQEHLWADSPEARRFVVEAGGSPTITPARAHLTVIGTEEERRAVLHDLATNPELIALVKEGVDVQDYAPTDWAVTSIGLPSAGKPSIILQSRAAPGQKLGRVLYRATSYAGGPTKLAEELRKANPDYRPDLDPGVKPGVGGGDCPLGFDSRHWPGILVAIAAIVMLWSKPKGK